MKARKVIIIRPSLFVRTIKSAAKIDWPGDTNTIPYSGQKSNWLFVGKLPDFRCDSMLLREEDSDFCFGGIEKSPREW